MKGRCCFMSDPVKAKENNDPLIFKTNRDLPADGRPDPLVASMYAEEELQTKITTVEKQKEIAMSTKQSAETVKETEEHATAAPSEPVRARRDPLAAVWGTETESMPMPQVPQATEGLTLEAETLAAKAEQTSDISVSGSIWQDPLIRGEKRSEIYRLDAKQENNLDGSKPVAEQDAPREHFAEVVGQAPRQLDPIESVFSSFSGSSSEKRVTSVSRDGPKIPKRKEDESLDSFFDLLEDMYGKSFSPQKKQGTRPEQRIIRGFDDAGRAITVGQYICPQCNGPILPNSEFCAFCGIELPAERRLLVKYCRRCGQKVPADTNKCEQCGAEW